MTKNVCNQEQPTRKGKKKIFLHLKQEIYLLFHACVVRPEDNEAEFSQENDESKTTL